MQQIRLLVMEARVLHHQSQAHLSHGQVVVVVVLKDKPLEQDKVVVVTEQTITPLLVLALQIQVAAVVAVDMLVETEVLEATAALAWLSLNTQTR
jgi:hypothetical protein